MEQQPMKMQSDEVNELFAALSKAQSELKPAAKDGVNPAFAKGNNPQAGKFNSLTACWESCRECLAKNQLAVVQTPIVSQGTYYLVTTLGHATGQYIKSITPLLLAKNDSQSFGAAMTYFRRFSLCAIVGISPEDDDGAAERIKAEKAEEQEKLRNYPKPTAEQVNELRAIIKQCPQDFINEVGVAVASRKVNGLQDLDLPTFNNLAANAAKKLAECQAALQEQVSPE